MSLLNGRLNLSIGYLDKYIAKERSKLSEASLKSNPDNVNDTILLDISQKISNAEIIKDKLIESIKSIQSRLPPTKKDPTGGNSYNNWGNELDLSMFNLNPSLNIKL